MSSLAAYYQAVGLDASQWHVGPEHPRLEEHAIEVLRARRGRRLLEIGYQAGGFAVPVITAMAGSDGFAYTGIDSGAYRNTVAGATIEGYLRQQGVDADYRFLTGDAGTMLHRLAGKQFDVILIDHFKPLYPREFRTILRLGLASADAHVLFHDVLGRAEREWVACRRLCDAFGFTWEIRDDVPGGLAVARRDAALPTGGPRRLAGRLAVDAGLAYRRARSAAAGLLGRGAR